MITKASGRLKRYVGYTAFVSIAVCLSISLYVNLRLLPYRSTSHARWVDYTSAISGDHVSLQNRNRFVQTSRYSVFVREFGSTTGSPTLVLLHGFQRSGTTFLPLVERLRNDYRLLVVDLPAHGNSFRSDIAATYTPDMNDMVEAVQSLKEEYDLGRLNIAGHSLGGMVAVEFASQYPNSINKLVMLESMVSQDQWQIEDSYDEYADDYYIERGGSGVDMASVIVNVSLHGVRTYEAFSESIREWDRTATYTNSTTPILWLNYVNDIYDRIHFENRLDALAGGTHDYGLRPLITYYRAGHFFHWTVPDQVAAEIVRFVD